MHYVGNYNNYQKNGFGYQLFGNGLLYKGEFKDDIKINGVIMNL